jgi:hypothetical protein
VQPRRMRVRMIGSSRDHHVPLLATASLSASTLEDESDQQQRAAIVGVSTPPADAHSLPVMALHGSPSTAGRKHPRELQAEKAIMLQQPSAQVAPVDTSRGVSASPADEDDSTDDRSGGGSCHQCKVSRRKRGMKITVDAAEAYI